MSQKSGRISDCLKKEVEDHENRLQEISQKLTHANTHFVALSDISQRLRFHLDVQKSRRGLDLFANLDESENSGYKSAKEDLHFQFPEKGIPNERDFLTMVESLIEGIILIGSEVNLGKIAKDLKGPVFEGDMYNWRHVIHILQKYDDQVRRAIEYSERQHPLNKESQEAEKQNKDK